MGVHVGTREAAYEARKEKERSGTECEAGGNRGVETENPPKGAFVTA